MDFVKRNPILTAVLAFCVAAFAAESYFLWTFNSKAAASQRALKSARDSAESAQKISPAPNEANKAAALKNVDELQDKLNQTTATLTDTPIKITNVPTSGPDLLVEVQSYVTKLQAKAKDKDVVLPSADFAFGMGMYVGHPLAPPVEKIPAVYTQMVVLDYILGHLISDAKQDNQKMMITSVLRENAGAGSSSDPGAANEIFTIPSTVTARGPGVNALAFQIQFISYTESLRILLDDLKAFEMPLVVRNIEVEPATESSITTASGTSPAGTSVQSRSREKESAADAAAKKPVVAENLSKFTLTIEYIQLPQEPKPATPAADGSAGTATPEAPAATAK